MPPLNATSFKFVWSHAEKLGTLASLLFLLAMILGFRIDRPNDRMAKLEAADAKMMALIDSTGAAINRQTAQVDMLYRVQCLNLSRKQAAMMGACRGYETAP